MEEPKQKSSRADDRELNLALGHSKTTAKWKNRTMTWGELLKGDPKNLLPIKATEIRNTMNAMDGWERNPQGRGRLGCRIEF